MGQPIVAVVTADLLAIGRVESAARSAGWAVETVRLGSDLAGLEPPPDLVIVDLEALPKEELVEIGSRSDVVGFFSHVDEELGQSAAAAGIEALPRGRFWRELPALLERLGGS